jgi:hypothetical protein
MQSLLLLRLQAKHQLKRHHSLDLEQYFELFKKQKIIFIIPNNMETLWNEY